MQSNIGLIERLEETLKSNIVYVRENGYEGMEPHMLGDLYFTNKANLSPSFINKVLRKLEVKMIDFFPSLLIPYMGLLRLSKKQLTPYALAHFIQAYSNTHELKVFGDFEKEIEELSDLLFNTLSKSENGYGATNAKNQKSNALGEIFTNEETVYAPAGTESIIGYIKAYNSLSNSKYIEIAKKIAARFDNDFCFKEVDEKKGCFDYSGDGDGVHILNASILIAYTLSLIDSNEYKEKAISAFNYVLDYLSYDEIPYAGVEDKKHNKNWKCYDCYHTGFVLRSMLGLDKIYFNSKHQALLINKAKIFFNDFSINNIVCMLKNDKVFDIHSFAEYIRMYSDFYLYLSNQEKKMIEKTIVESMKFYISKIEVGRYIYRSKHGRILDVYMPLWGQSAMMNSISSLLITLKK